MKKSLVALWLCIALFFSASFIYFPMYKLPVNNTLSWDVRGYYYYLPAIFIYKDIRHLSFSDSVEAKYNQNVTFGPSFDTKYGKTIVMKYPIGQAIVMSIPFFAALAYTSLTPGYPPDGFSLPFHFTQQVWAFLIFLIGIIFLRKLLLKYFSDTATALTLLTLCFATNYLEYGAIQNSMTHNSLFTAYVFVIWLSNKWYENQGLKYILLVGLLIGLMTIIRPTEIIAVLIPLLWGLGGNVREALRSRFRFLAAHLPQLIPAAITGALVIFIQLFYWKYVSGQWIVYSYEDQGFSWLSPHIYNGLFHVNAGWLLYTPVMLIAIAGAVRAIVISSRRGTPISTWLIGSVVFSLIFAYICFAWDVWNYGGSTSVRAMVQSYPVLCFFIASFFDQLPTDFKYKALLNSFIVFCIIYNLWLHHQCHRGGLMHAGNMTDRYLERILFKSKKTVPASSLKLLDTDYDIIGPIKDKVVLYENNFENDSTHCQTILNGKNSGCIKENELGSAMLPFVIKMK